MKTLLLIISAAAVVLSTAGCATQTGSARSSGYGSPQQEYGSVYGSKVFR